MTYIHFIDLAESVITTYEDIGTVTVAPATGKVITGYLDIFPVDEQGKPTMNYKEYAEFKIKQQLERKEAKAKEKNEGKN